MTEQMPEPDFYTSRHEIVGHTITHRYVNSDGTRITRVEFADGTTEEFEISESLARAVESELNIIEEDVA